MPSRIALNTLFQVLARGVEFLSGILVNAWLARNWGSTAFGQIGCYTSLAGTCSFLFDFGLGSLLQRSIARDRAQARVLLLHALAAMLPFSLLGTLVILGVGRAWSLSPGLLLLVSLPMVLSGFSLLIQAVFFAYERMEWESLSVCCDRACWLLAGLWLAFQRPSLPHFFLFLTLCKGVSLLVGGFFLCRLVRPRPIPLRLSTMTALIRESWPFALNLVCSTLYVGVDVLFLARWVGESQAGFYRAACMLIVPLTVIMGALNNALFPQMALSEEGLRRFGQASVRTALAAAIPLTLLVILFAPAMVRLLFGAKFGPSVPLLQLLALVVPLRFVNHSLATVLTAADQQKERTRVAAAAALFNILSNLLVIGRWGTVGACLTTLLTDLLRTLLYWLQTRPRVGLSLDRKTLLCLMLAGGILLPLTWARVPLFPAAMLLGLLYPLSLWKFFAPELAMLRRSP